MNTITEPMCRGEFVDGFIQAVVEISPAFERKIRDVLAENGIEEPRAGETYPADYVIDSINQLAEDVGPKTTTRIAVNQIRIPDWPEGIDDVEQALDASDDMYRGAYIDFDRDRLGAFRFEKTGAGRGRGAVTEDFPYPEAFAEGIFEGTLKEFTSESSLPTVSETETRADEKAAFELRW